MEDFLFISMVSEDFRFVSMVLEDSSRHEGPDAGAAPGESPKMGEKSEKTGKEAKKSAPGTSKMGEGRG